MKNTEIPYKNLSTDYERLYELLMIGNTIVGFMDDINGVNVAHIFIDPDGDCFDLRVGNYVWCSRTLEQGRLQQLCNEYNFRFFDPEEPTTNLIQINEPFGYEYEATACCQSGPITNENYCPKCGRKIVK